MSAASKDAIVPCQFIWQGVEIEVTYDPDWLGMSRCGLFTAHLEVRVIRPEGAALPFTTTGYRSRFLPQGDVEAEGGVENYVRCWLDWAASDPAWKELEFKSRQLSLF